MHGVPILESAGWIELGATKFSMWKRSTPDSSAYWRFGSVSCTWTIIPLIRLWPDASGYGLGSPVSSTDSVKRVISNEAGLVKTSIRTLGRRKRVNCDTEDCGTRVQAIPLICRSESV